MCTALYHRYDGGMVLVSHDFRLIDQVANQIWVCENKKVRRAICILDVDLDMHPDPSGPYGCRVHMRATPPPCPTWPTHAPYAPLTHPFNI